MCFVFCFLLLMFVCLFLKCAVCVCLFVCVCVCCLFNFKKPMNFFFGLCKVYVVFGLRLKQMQIKKKKQRKYGITAFVLFPETARKKTIKKLQKLNFQVITRDKKKASTCNLKTSHKLKIFRHKKFPKNKFVIFFFCVC